MIKLSDICEGIAICHSNDPTDARYCPGNSDPAHCDGCICAGCACGLPWDPERGWHTRSGIRLPPDVYSRILAREGEAIDVKARREAEREAIRASRRMTIGGGR